MGNNNNLIDRLIKDSKMDEEVKNNPGFGKPFPNSFFSGDVYSNFLNIAKEAGYLPSWINLQQEIREKIALILQMMEQNVMESNIKDAMDEINVKIAKYNNACPPSIQRGRISIENIADRYKFWEVRRNFFKGTTTLFKKSVNSIYIEFLLLGEG